VSRLDIHKQQSQQTTPESSEHYLSVQYNTIQYSRFTVDSSNPQHRSNTPPALKMVDFTPQQHHQSDLALEGFKALACTTSGQQLTMILHQVFKHPMIYSFIDLLHIPAIQQLQQHTDTKIRAYYHLLHIFAFGTYNDYLQNKATLPALSPAEIQKLQQLTLLSLASTSSSKHLSYGDMMKHLSIDVNDMRQMEDLIIDTMYKNLLSGTFNEQQEVFHVTYSMSRDVNIFDAEQRQLNLMLNRINEWHTVIQQHAEKLNYDLNYHIAAKNQEQQIEADLNQQRNNIIEEIKQQKSKDNKSSDRQQQHQHQYDDNDSGGKRGGSSLKKLSSMLSRR